ncbi:MAG: hypothetical protein O3A80_05255 [bacterium]|nr:hypothetical protein [bacterium]MDA1292595.1 hypothetical protein [bacterium]
MTKPRTNPDRELFGIIGKVDDISAEKKWWNARFLQEGKDAFMDSYPTKEQELPERLSEMFHFDRRGYIVGKPLQEAIIPLLDALDSSVGLALNPSEASGAGEGRVDFVLNTGGIMTGYLLGNHEKMWLLSVEK